MKKYLFILLLLGAFIQKPHAQTFPWVDSLYGIMTLGTGPVGYGVCTDDSDNVFVTSGVPASFCLRKYKSNGILEWSIPKSFGYGIGVAADHSGNAYIAGGYFFAKYNSNGILIHKDSARIGGNAIVFSGNAISYDGGKYLYITGDFAQATGATVIFGTKAITFGTNPMGFILKCDTAGNVIWAKAAQIGKFPSEFHPLGINANTNGLIYITGYFADSVLLGVDSVNTNLSQIMSFVACYDTGGNVKWAHSTGRYNSTSNAVSSDGVGNVYITGNAGQYAGSFIAKYRSNGDSVWWSQCPSNRNEVSFGYGICTNSSGISFITGSFQGAPFGSLTVQSRPGGINNIYIVEYDSAGNAIWGYDPNDTLPNSVWNSGCAVGIGNTETGSCDFYFTGVTQTPAKFNSYVNLSQSSEFYVTELKNGCLLTNTSNQLQLKEAIKVYPNPFSSSTTILFSESGKHQLEVEDMTGRILQKFTCNGQQYELKRGNLASGMYFIKVTDAQNNVYVSKILVE